MNLEEFSEQSKYCRENNVPEGIGCDGCPAKDRAHCADALVNLCGKFRESVNNPKELDAISGQLERDYGLTPYNQLAIFKGVLEFPK